MSSLPKTYKAAQISKPGKGFEFVDREMTQPKQGEILVKVAACGVCHSEELTYHQVLPFITLPKVPGHEIVGHVAAVPEGEKKWKVGQLVGGGWHGYAEYCLLRTEAVVALPEGANPLEVAPLLCAGVTVFNGMRNVEGVRPGDLVAVQGIGGLGHLAIQFAKAMGYDVVALSTSEDKRDLAKKLGADHYIVGKADEQSKKLQELGGAKMIVVTAPNPKAVSPLIDGLMPHGTLLVLGLQTEPVPFNLAHMLTNSLKVKGHPSGTAADSEDTVKFALAKGVKSQNEVFDFKDCQKAYDQMMAGKPRFRYVLKMT